MSHKTLYKVCVRCCVSDNRTKYVLGRDDGVLVLRREGGEMLDLLKAHNGKVWCLHRVSSSPSFSFASGSDQGVVKIWQAGSSLKLVSTCIGHVRAVWSMCCIKRHFEITRLATASADSTVRIWNIQSGACLRTLGHIDTGTILSISVSPDQRSFAYAGDDHTVRLSNVHYDNSSVVLRGHVAAVYKVLFLKSNLYKLVTSSWDRTIRVWDLNTEKNTVILKGHSRCVRDMVELTSNRLLSAADDGSIGLWCLRRESLICIIQAHEKTIGKLFVLDDDEDDDFVASISDDGKIKLWDFSVNSRNTTSSPSALLTFDGNRSNYLLDIARLANGLVSTCELGSAVEWI